MFKLSQSKLTNRSKSTNLGSLIVIACMLMLFFVSCKDDSATNSETDSSVSSEKKSDNVLIDYIKTPLDKANAIKDKSEARDRELEDLTGEISGQSEENDTEK